jgi:hypothetical protein
MAVKTKYYYGDPEAYDIRDAELTNVNVLQITRSGATYSQGSPAAGLICVYQNAFGRILFGEPFTGPDDPSLPVTINDLEKVSIKFKY